VACTPSDYLPQYGSTSLHVLELLPSAVRALHTVRKCCQCSSLAAGLAADTPGCGQGVLLDQYGVLHDGRQAYPGAVAAVEALAASGRKLLIISNSSRRAPP